MGWGCIQELFGIFVQVLSIVKKGDIVGSICFGVGFYILKVNDLCGESKNILVIEVYVCYILLKLLLIMIDEQVCVKLEQIVVDIKSGKMIFVVVVKEFFQDLGFVNQGGDFGWVILDIFDLVFCDVLICLNKG